LKHTWCEHAEGGIRATSKDHHSSRAIGTWLPDGGALTLGGVGGGKFAVDDTGSPGVSFEAEFHEEHVDDAPGDE
jgi:hypothetical protein